MGDSVEFGRLDERTLFFWQGRLHEKISRRWAVRHSDYRPLPVEPQTSVYPILMRSGEPVSAADLEDILMRA